MLAFGMKEQGKAYVLREAAYAVIFQEGRVAVVKTGQGYFLPGGGTKKQENYKEALERECVEELGWKIKVGKHIGEAKQYFYSNPEDAYFEGAANFFLTYRESNQEVLGEEDHILEWKKPEDIISKMRHEYQGWAISEGKRIRGDS